MEAKRTPLFCGEYYAIGKTVSKNPVETKVDGSRKISMGFPVCIVTDYVGPEGAAIIAAILSAHDRVMAERDALAEALKTIAEWPITSRFNLDAVNMIEVARVAIAKLEP